MQTSLRASVRDPGRCRTVVVCRSTASTRCFWNLRQGSSAATPLVLLWRPPTRRAHRFTFSLCQVSPLPRHSIVSVMNIVRVQFKVDGCMQNFNVWNKRQESLHTILHCAAIIPVREWKNVNGWISLILSPNPIYSPMFIGVQSFISSYRHTLFWSPPSLQNFALKTFNWKTTLSSDGPFLCTEKLHVWILW